MGENKFTIEELENRIADINSHYLTNAIKNEDKKMIKHWNNVLQNYEKNLMYLRSVQK